MATRIGPKPEGYAVLTLGQWSQGAGVDSAIATFSQVEVAVDERNRLNEIAGRAPLFTFRPQYIVEPWWTLHGRRSWLNPQPR